MEVRIETKGKKQLVKIEGRLDTINVIAFEKEITTLFAGDLPDIQLECENLTYISSSGLRIFLTLQKSVMARKGMLVVKGLKPEIKDIFDMTGFSSIFTLC